MKIVFQPAGPSGLAHSTAERIKLQKNSDKSFLCSCLSGFDVAEWKLIIQVERRLAATHSGDQHHWSEMVERIQSQKGDSSKDFGFTLLERGATRALEPCSCCICRR